MIGAAPLHYSTLPPAPPRSRPHCAWRQLRALRGRYPQEPRRAAHPSEARRASHSAGVQGGDRKPEPGADRACRGLSRHAGLRWEVVWCCSVGACGDAHSPSIVLQLESSLFGVLVVHVKPQLELLLNLPPDALTKEVALTQDLTELFIKYQASGRVGV